MKSLLIPIVIACLMGAGAGYGVTFAEFSKGGNHFDLVNMVDPPKGPVDSQVTSDAPRPKVLVLNGEDHDFGSMEYRTTATHDFKFKNEGDADLTLKLGDTTCKCTLGKLESDVVRPGETLNVTLEWEAKELNPQFRQEAEIITNDPARRAIRLSVRGRVLSRVRLHPNSIVFSDITSSVEKETTFRIEARSVKGYKIEEHSFSNPVTASFFELTSRPLAVAELSPDGEEGYVFTLKIKPGMQAGPFNQTLHLVGNMEPKMLQVPIQGNVVSDVSIIGGKNFVGKKQVLNWKVISRATGAETKLYVLVKGAKRDGIDVKIASVHPDVVKVKLGESKKSAKVTTYPLEISIPRGAPQMNHLGSEQGKYGRIIINTNHPDAERLVVWVRFAIKD
ncbi:MAG: DUF1573 domain-containing protein [Pirellulaceae bacterium]|jgi:hypothetical protein|nr:DUF1573 domain-containing protein [Pirellulaceae bacterium]MDP7017675.1 DUF1573 domain-containing protein [Pirellulaceae bacterium]